MLQIVSDVNIPFVKEAFGSLGQVQTLPADAIGRERCQQADILLIRSVTQVNERLLTGSPVRFVGSATAGTDHVDLMYLAQQRIPFVHAPGSNADSVVEYVLTALLHLACLHNRSLEGVTLGIVGCGNIGGALATRAPALGLRVLRNDPPKAARGGAGYVCLEELLADSDIVSLHVPLTSQTYHLIDASALTRMRPNAWLVNTSVVLWSITML